MKQTAVEWLIDKLDKIYHIKEKFLSSDWEFLEETSKKIEKEQMVDFVIKWMGEDDLKDDIIKHYNETFNTNEK
jgi:hypothetical protein